MCGRIALYSDPPHLARLFDAGLDPDLADGLTPHWNIGPTATILGVSEDQGGQRMVRAYRWGLVPGWAKDPSTLRNTFNARAESVATKPMFQSAFRRGRILVPADAFYEWAPGPPKQPYAFRRADGEPVVFAGLREWWRGDDGTEIHSASVITTAAGPDMPIHNRQPVVLDRRSWEQWLDPTTKDTERLERLLVPGAAGTLVHYPVRREVGNVRNDRPDLIDDMTAV